MSVARCLELVSCCMIAGILAGAQSQPSKSSNEELDTKTRQTLARVETVTASSELANGFLPPIQCMWISSELATTTGFNC